MRKFLQTNIINKIFLGAFVIYGAGLLLHYLFDFHWLLYLAGFFMAFFISGLSINNLVFFKNDWFAKLITAPIFTIFFFMPLYWLLTALAHYEINFFLAFMILIVISACSFIITYKKNDPRNAIKNEDRKFIIFGSAAFILVHAATVLVYKFIPEVDGYSYLINIERNLSTGFFEALSRPLFILFAEYLSVISFISPYWLFKFGIIVIQISGAYYLYQIIKEAGVKKSFLRYLILLAWVSVPVVNLEIDYIRPNVIFISSLLPFIYHLAKGCGGSYKNLIVSFIIALAGTFYHEFFCLLMLIFLLYASVYFYKKLGNFYRLILFVAASIIAVAVLVNIEKFPSLQFVAQSVSDLVSTLAKGVKWRWWFLGCYLNIDMIDLGWSGMHNILKYYAYSVSPFLFLVLFFYPVSLFLRVRKNRCVNSIEIISISMLLVGLLFAEFLPRISFKTLPDRFWPMIAMSLLVLSPFLLVEIKGISRKIIQASILLLLFIGIGGSIYVAKEKQGYVSEREFKASQWIKDNTQEDSFFITQGGNGIIVDYFAKRKFVIPYSSFFAEKDSGDESQTKISKSAEIYKTTGILFSESLREPSDYRLTALNESIKNYYKEMEKERLAKNVEIPEFKLPNNENLYVLYSIDKFNNYYGQRQWWRNVNFFGADLSKFQDGYDLVYNDSDIIYIWKKK